MINTSFKAKIKRRFRDPLWQFIAIAPLLYWLFGLFPVVDDKAVPLIQLQDLLQRVAMERNIAAADVSEYWELLPEPERKTIVSQFLETKLLAIHASELGLMQSDAVIEGRLAQKLRYSVKYSSQLPRSSDDELMAYYSQHPRYYTTQSRHTFSYTIGRVEEDKLVNPELYSPLSFDDFRLSQLYMTDDMSLIQKFGAEFVQQLTHLPLGHWQGPFTSTFAEHWVWVHARDEAELQPFEAVKDQVNRDWRNTSQQRLLTDYVEGLSTRYRHLFDKELLP
jgi:hypothetical protein